ncbi:hypothetical protein Fot_21729 [Forsythia ovata]|uniref:Uncharacterized protein n=1 Tax=Forsythia ovata TaxID=205694 RepID=A0ABD1UXJ8_9LAMI
MSRARDNHTQQRYNHGGHVNTKPYDGGMRHQTGHRQGTHQRPFLETGSSYAAEITEAILNLHAGMNSSNSRNAYWRSKLQKIGNNEQAATLQQPKIQGQRQLRIFKVQ